MQSTPNFIQGVRPAMHVDLTKLGYTQDYQPTTSAPLTWESGSGQDLTFTIKPTTGTDTSFDRFEGLSIDDKTLNRDTDFTASPGSIVITIKSDVLDDLSTGTHTITVTFDNGTVTLPLEIKTATVTPNEAIKTTSPPTGDTFDPVLYISLLALALISAPRILTRINHNK